MVRRQPTCREGRGRGIALWQVDGVGTKHEAAIVCSAPVHRCAAAHIPSSQHPLLVPVIYHPGCRQRGQESAGTSESSGTIVHDPGYWQMAKHSAKTSASPRTLMHLACLCAMLHTASGNPQMQKSVLCLPLIYLGLLPRLCKWVGRLQWQNSPV